MRDREGSGGAIEQTALALGSVSSHPLSGAPDTHFGGLGRPRNRPRLINDSLTKLPAPIQAERRVSMQIHPVLLGLGCLAAPSFQGDPDEPTYSGTTASSGLCALIPSVHARSAARSRPARSQARDAYNS